MGNCIQTEETTDGHNIEDTTIPPSPSGGTKEIVRESSLKKISHPLPPPPPPQQISSIPKAQKLPIPKQEGEIIFSPHLKAFAFNELRTATINFRPDCLLGEGGFGYVYKGWLQKETLTPAEPGSGLSVAVKKLKPQGFQGHKEWLSEVTYLGQLRHPNLVKLIGYCSDGENKLLVYEYMPRGSLENHLFRRGVEPLSWGVRIKVAVEAARGLSFLHNSEPQQVIYRDFKSSNILLDMDYNAKLSDFGLAKAGPTGDLTHVTTRVMGTEGYTAPEYIATGRLTAKCDVYSFGIVLLEIITGRRALDDKRVGNEQKLLEWVKPQLSDAKKLFRIMDSKLEGQYSRKGAYVVANLALQCAHMEPRYRPHMSDVLSILEKLLPNSHNREPTDHHEKKSTSKSTSHPNQSRHPYPPWSPQGSPVRPFR